ncbi:MAG TPA: WecB/TagA/CpsF family glycosyltransferase [Longimicrobium sp.]|nr:WecB/TagA/CpsF family glycosyltransferase [Longimicrobium sp.]
METRTIVGTRIHAASCRETVERVIGWARAGESRAVCCANVHVVMEARADPGFAAALGSADHLAPDGMPLAWALRLLGVPRAERVYGPALMLEVCAAAEREGIPVALVGSTPPTLAALEAALARRHPALRVAWRQSPPFHEATEEERAAARRAVEASGARILFVGLGCPRQERWMAAERGRLGAVMLGVGAAFDFHAGSKPQAPAWLGRLGLEWAFRLATEPRRLWRRYLVNNPRFVALFTMQLARGALARARNAGAPPAPTQEAEP